jgi:hypothetical protein
MSTVAVICQECGKEFQRYIGEYNRRIRLGRPQFCCQACSERHHFDKKLRPYIGTNNQNLKPNNKLDEFSPFRFYLKRIKDRFQNGGHNVDITLEDLKTQWDKQNGKCPYAGIAMSINRTSAELSKFQPYKASLDRIDSSKPYTIDNIEFVSCMAQFGKNIWSKQEFIDFCKKVAEFHKGD